MTSEDSHSPRSARSIILLHLGLILMLVALGIHQVEVDRRIAITALLCAILVTAARFQIQRFFRPPVWMRWVLLPALISAPPFSLISLPSPISVFVPVFALAWILSSRRVIRIPLVSQAVILFLVAWRLLSLESTLPIFEFPRFPTSTPVWIGIAITIPLGIATQTRLRGFAKYVILAELTLVFLAASLIPLVIQTANGFKEIGEPERDFYRITPLPGFRTVPNPGSDEILPSELRKLPHPVAGIKVLDLMNLSLQPHRLEFSWGELDQRQTLLLLQQTGFLQKDRFGYFVPPHAFGDPQPPEGVSPEFMGAVRQLALQASLDSTDPDVQQTLSADSDLHFDEDRLHSVLLRLRNLNLSDTLPNNSSSFRLTPQARRRFENGLFPRQILFATKVENSPGLRIHHADYAPEWNLSFDETRLELIQLVDVDVLEIDKSISWRSDVLKELNVVWASAPKVILLMLSGIIVLAFACKPGGPPAIFRTLCFCLGMLTVYVCAGLTAPGTPFVIQAVWSTMWLPVSALLIGFSLVKVHA